MCEIFIVILREREREREREVRKGGIEGAWDRGRGGCGKQGGREGSSLTGNVSA